MLAQITEMQGRLDDLKAEKAAASGKAAKDKVQKKIRTLTNEINAKTAEAAKL